MPLRRLLLSLLVLAVVAPGAEASVADHVLPFKDASDGVEAVMGKRTPVLRFGPRAAKLYRGLAGRNASVGCGRPGISSSIESADGSVTTWGGGSFDSDTGLLELDGGGYAGTDMRLPRSGARVKLPFTGDPYDVCFIATPARRSDRECLDPSFLDDASACVRVLVALTAPGKTGVYLNGVTRVVAVTLRDGTRKFVRWDGDVYSTNVAEFAGNSEASLRLP